MGYILDNDIQFLSGVGERRARLLRSELGIRTLGDLLYHFPFRYIDRSRIWRIGELRDDSLTYVQLQVRITGFRHVGAGAKKRFVATVADATGTAELVWFKGIGWIEKRLEQGREYVVFGRPAFFGGVLSLVHPEVESVLDQKNRFHSSVQGVYSTTEKLSNAQFRQSFAGNWGDGTTSSSDGQNFRTGSKAESTGHINPKYGSSPGRTFYTHISDQYAPFSTKVVNVGVRDSTYVLDGLLYHESDLRIEEHYTDTAGFTDHVFGLMHLLGFRFAPRIRDLGDTKLFIPKGDAAYDALKPMISSDRLNIKQIRAHWDEILRFATSIKQGTVTASLMLRKLGSYPRQNGLAVALRELGRIERTLFILDWLQSVELRRRVQAGLNKGEARNALARAVFFNRLGEIRDRSFEQQRYRASGLNLVTAAIVLWNTVYLERATSALRAHGKALDDTLLQYLSPLGWEHINLTGDYLWRSSAKIGAGKFRPLRPLQPA